MNIPNEFATSCGALGGALLMLAVKSTSPGHAECAFVRQVMIGLKVQGFVDKMTAEAFPRCDRRRTGWPRRLIAVDRFTDEMKRAGRENVPKQMAAKSPLLRGHGGDL